MRSCETIGQEDIISVMAGKNASVSRQEIPAVLDLFNTVIRDILLAGDRAATDLFHARVSIRGGFETAAAEYESGKNTVNVRMIPAASLKKAVARRAGGKNPRPYARPEGGQRL